MKPITMCFAYYRNYGILKEQLHRFRQMPSHLKQYLRLIVVDDGSALLQNDETTLPPIARAAVLEPVGFPFDLYRMKVNIRWNQDACRNLAVDKAKTEWVLLLDMDHIPPLETLLNLVSGHHMPGTVYTFTRRTWEPNHTVTPYKPHPNSWFMTKEMFTRIGGYDELFAGLYGTDADFKERVENTAGAPLMLEDHIIRVPRETIPDASTVTYERKTLLDAAFKERRRRRNATPGWRPLRLTFAYEKVTG